VIGTADPGGEGVALRGVLVLGGLVVGVPAAELLGALLLGGFALFRGVAGADFSEGALCSGDGVGGLVGGGHPDGVLFGGCGLGRGRLAQVGFCGLSDRRVHLPESAGFGSLLDGSLFGCG